MANRGGSVTASTLDQPAGIANDASDNLWVTDFGNERVLVYQKPLASGGGTPGVPSSKGDATADRVFGQTSLTVDDGCNNYGGLGEGRTSQTICSPAGLAVEGSDRLWLADGGNHRVLRYDSPLTGDDAADAVIGPIDFMASGSQCRFAVHTAAGFCSPYQVAFDPAGNLWVSDGGSYRVVVFDQ